MNKSVSPSRTYMAMCSGPNFIGYRFKKFVLPETDSGPLGGDQRTLENDSLTASWYYLNRLDSFSFIDGSISFEDFAAAFPANSLLRQLLRAQRLLKNIEQGLTSSGQVSNALRDIQEFFEKNPSLED